MTAYVATVGGAPVPVAEIDRREALLRTGPQVSRLPAHDTSEGRQLRRWLTQLVVTEKVVAIEADARGITSACAPAEDEVLPDASARFDVGSVAAAVLAEPLARAVFAEVTAGVDVSEDDLESYHRRNPRRFAALTELGNGWRTTASVAVSFHEVRPVIRAELRAAARRRAFRQWLDVRRADLVVLSPGYEHPGDPRQPDNTHKH